MLIYHTFGFNSFHGGGGGSSTDLAVFPLSRPISSNFQNLQWGEINALNPYHTVLTDLFQPPQTQVHVLTRQFTCFDTLNTLIPGHYFLKTADPYLDWPLNTNPTSATKIVQLNTSYNFMQ